MTKEKFICYECHKETTFDKDDYIGSGLKQQKETIIQFETSLELELTPITKEIIINCSNPKCSKPNKITIEYYD